MSPFVATRGTTFVGSRTYIADDDAAAVPLFQDVTVLPWISFDVIQCSTNLIRFW